MGLPTVGRSRGPWQNIWMVSGGAVHPSVAADAGFQTPIDFAFRRLMIVLAMLGVFLAPVGISAAASAMTSAALQRTTGMVAMAQMPARRAAPLTNRRNRAIATRLVLCL